MDEKFMKRALQLARGGEGRVAPNPMVGAVVVADGRIIGEGFHRTYGGPHAEVNAIRSVNETDRHLLSESTIYVTLEPCSHYGKTPPCAKLIIDTGIPRVVVGAPDPNPLVAGRGIRMLREAGIEVIENVMKEECIEINKRFMTAQTHPRPFIQLKWAQSADGFMAAFDNEGQPVPVKFSSPLSSVWMHRERANAEAIMVGANTRRIDSPRLNVRNWAGKNPRIIDCLHDTDCSRLVEDLRKEGITSLMVEGGPTLLKSFIDAALYDEIRVETAPQALGKGLPAPRLPQDITLISSEKCRQNTIDTYRRLNGI
ncbi:MAG: bifunctional diaminohydroxyphosphoribosylaminopyrimidine deaminase/5-amino-6-(5-phosphoribosylamino)uracil reductase RibD [Muribaculaceae bacterium]|nr:bifunctional diaminohydroxyphosphoribosylaminopyrimidine deaminase/5-amino-6-(5-phosphoribosylamino)uracil reductase RibD [Muribaculaceae bacterium]